MNSGGQEAGSQGSSGGQNAGSNGGQATTTTAQQNQQTTTAGFQTSTTSQSTHGPTSTSTSASSSSSGVQKGVVIGAVVGGLCLLLVLALIGVCLMQRRKKKQIAKKNGTTEPVTYAGLNAAFTGVPFTSNQERPNSLVPEPLSLHPSSTGSGVALRGGEASPYATSPYASEGDHFLPTYAESQSDASRRNRNSLGRIDTSGTLHDSTYVSPLSTGTFTPHSQAQTYQPTPTMPSVPTPGRLMRSETSDTMGFPNDNPYEGLELPPMPRMPAGSRDTVDTMGFPVSVPVEPQLEVPVIAPRPVHPMVSQNSLERIAVQHTGNTSSPTLGYGDAQGSRSHTQPPSSSLNQTYNGGAWSGSGVGRNISQRTVDSVSSYAPPMVSDEELERLGVGSRYGPKR